MTHGVTPMIHVPDVRATVAWYQRIGFELQRANEDCGEMDWALMAFGEREVMFSAGGQASDAFRREVDLYLHVPDVDARFAALDADVDVFEPLHDTFYGMREFIIRDCNRFWITFAQPIP